MGSCQAAAAPLRLAIFRLAKAPKSLEKRVYVIPPEVDREIARLKLESMGIQIDRLTPEQEKYLNAWEHGT